MKSLQCEIICIGETISTNVWNQEYTNTRPHEPGLESAYLAINGLAISGPSRNPIDRGNVIVLNYNLREARRFFKLHTIDISRCTFLISQIHGRENFQITSTRGFQVPDACSC